MIKKVLVGVIAIIMIVGLMPVQKTSAATIEELQALIMQLQAQLAALSGGQATTGTGYQFTRNLTLGSTGADVTELQKVLIAGGYLKLTTPTQLFGPMTKAALVAWQKAMGITPTSGYFGPLSRAKINGTGGVVVIPTDSYLKVEAAGPAATTIPDGSIYNPVLKLKVSAGKDAVSITGLTVTRGGYIANTYVTGLSVWDDMGNRYGNILTSLTSDGKASFSFGSTPFTVPAGTSKYLTLAANIDGAASNGTISFSVDSASAVVATGGAVTGTFPIMGNTMTIVDGSTSLGDVRVSYQGSVGLSSTTYSASAGNVEVGYTDQEIAKIRFTQNNSKEGVYLNKLTVWVGGSFREGTDLKNFKLVSQDGTVVATADRAYDRYVTFNLATPYFIDKGYTRDFTVKTDITDGSGNYFYVTIQNDYDVVVKGATTGASVLALDSAGASLTSSDVQNDASGWFKIKQGVATVSKASTSPSGNIAPGSQSAVLARFEVKSGGEALEIRKMGIQIGNTNSLGLTGTVIVRDATTGATYLSIAADTTGVGSTTNSGITASTLLTYQQNLSSYISIPSGQSVILEVVGSISQSAASGSYTAHIGQLYAKRLSTNDYVTLAATDNAGNTLTVKDVTLSVTKDASYANTSLSVGAQNAKIGQFVLKASTADDIRVNTINLDVVSSSNIQNLRLMDGTTQLGTTKGTPTDAGNSFSLSNYVLAKDTPKTITVYADVLSSAVGPITVSVSNAGISGVGVGSGKSLSSTPNGAVALQQISFAAPTLTITKDASAPTSKIILAGQSGVELSKVRFEAVNEDLTLKKISFVITTPSTTIWTVTTTAANFTQVYLYDGSTLLGQGTVDSTNGTISLSGLNVTMPKDQQKVLTVKVDVSPSGTVVPVSVAGLQVYTTSTDNMEVYSSTGLLQTGITLTSGAASNYMLYHDAAPSVVNSLSNATKVGQTNDVIGKYTITNAAPAGGRTLTVATTSIVVSMGGSYSASSTVGTFKLYDESDTLIATGVGTTTAATTSLTVAFGPFTTAQEIAAGSSKAFTLKADTTNIRTGVASGSTVNLVTRISGTKGYTETAGSGPEYFWNTGGVVYKYTPANGGVLKDGNSASDSYQVDGATLTY